MSIPTVVASDIHKSFGEEGILTGVDLAVETGETFVLMGPNGVGKSVLLSCLAGSERPSTGTVEVLGGPATGDDGKTSFLLQDALCLDRLTGRENIRFYNQLHPDFTDEWREYVSRFGLAGDLEKRVEHYSGGMRRKLELTIALSIDAPIYILDEPTAALDLSVIQEIHSMFREKQRAGKTLIVASHLPMDAEVANRIAFLTADGIVATETPDDLFASMPPVLATADTNASVLTSIAVNGRMFESDGEVRGFLSADTHEDEATAIAGEHDLEIVEPTYTDLFNYWTEFSSTTDDR